MQTPITVSRLLDLKALVTDPSLIQPENLNLLSDSKMSCQTVIDGQNSIFILNPHDPSKRAQFQMTADAVAPHPSRSILALRAGRTVQIFDLEKTSRLKSAKIASNVEYFRWINDTTLGIVTASSVLHLNIEGKEDAVQKIEIMEDLEDCSFLNYRTTESGLWSVLFGRTQSSSGKVKGHMQLTEMKKQKRQHIACDYGELIEIKRDFDTEIETIACFVKDGQLHLHGMDKKAKFRQNVALPGFPVGDIVVGMPFSPKYGFLYVVSSSGAFWCVDVLSGTSLLALRLASTSIILASVENTGGFTAIDSEGVVQSVTINSNTILSQFTRVSPNPLAPVALSIRAELAGGEELCWEMFEKVFHEGDFKAAALIAAFSLHGVIRTAATIERFERASAAFRPSKAHSKKSKKKKDSDSESSSEEEKEAEQSPIEIYIATLMRTEKLNTVESIKLVPRMLGSASNMGKEAEKIKEMVDGGRIVCSEELGEEVERIAGDASSPALSSLLISIYSAADCAAKVLEKQIEAGETKKAVEFVVKKETENASIESLLPDILYRVCIRSPESAIKFGTQLCWLSKTGHSIKPSKKEKSKKRSSESATSEADPQSDPILAPSNLLYVLFALKLEKEATALMMDFVTKQYPQQQQIQTDYLTHLIQNRPDLSEQIINRSIFTQFDGDVVGTQAEESGLTELAAKLFVNPNDVARCVVKSVSTKTPEKTAALVHQCQTRLAPQLTPDTSIPVLVVRLLVQSREHQKLSGEIGHCLVDGKYRCASPDAVAAVFDEQNMFEAVFTVLKGVGDQESANHDSLLLFIRSCIHTHHITDSLTAISNTTTTNPTAILTLLRDECSDCMPLIVLCTKYALYSELCDVLVQRGDYQNLLEAIKYILKVNRNEPNNPAYSLIFSRLAENGAETDFIHKVMDSKDITPEWCDEEMILSAFERNDKMMHLDQWMLERIRINEASRQSGKPVQAPIVLYTSFALMCLRQLSAQSADCDSAANADTFSFHSSYFSELFVERDVNTIFGSSASSYTPYELFIFSSNLIPLFDLAFLAEQARSLTLPRAALALLYFSSSLKLVDTLPDTFRQSFSLDSSLTPANLFLQIAMDGKYHLAFSEFLMDSADQSLYLSLLTPTSASPSIDTTTRKAVLDNIITLSLPQCTDKNRIVCCCQSLLSLNEGEAVIDSLRNLVLPGVSESELKIPEKKWEERDWSYFSRSDVTTEGTTELATDRQLQNTLLICSIRTNHPSLISFIHMLSHFDPNEISKHSLRQKMIQATLDIYLHSGLYLNAMSLLVGEMSDLASAKRLCEKVNQEDCWKAYGRACMQNNDTKEAVEAFVRIGDAEDHQTVMQLCKEKNEYGLLVTFLKMAKYLNNSTINTELFIAMGIVEDLEGIKEELALGIEADFTKAGTECFLRSLFEAAELIFESDENDAMLALCEVKLGKDEAAVTHGLRSSDDRVVQTVMASCIHKNELKLAEKCAMFLVKQNQKTLLSTILFYTQRGHFKPIVECLEAVVEEGVEAMTPIATQLCILLSKHFPEQVKPFVKQHAEHLNVSETIAVFEQNEQWEELDLLFTLRQMYDNAIETVLQHPNIFVDSLIFDNIAKCTNNELIYKTFETLVSLVPAKASAFLCSVYTRIDPSRVITIARRLNVSELILEYLLFVQQKEADKKEAEEEFDSEGVWRKRKEVINSLLFTNSTAHPFQTQKSCEVMKVSLPVPSGICFNRAVNETTNTLLLSSYDVPVLIYSVMSHSCFNQISFVDKLKSTKSIQLTRLAAFILAANERFVEAVELLKELGLWGDVGRVVKLSGNAELALKTMEAVLLMKGEKNDREKKCVFGALLFELFDYLPLDRVIEWGWLNGLTEFTQPFIIQHSATTAAQVHTLQTQLDVAMQAIQALQQQIAPAASGKREREAKEERSEKKEKSKKRTERSSKGE
ncbi:putative Clathrin heavy chain 1 [Blattamonas nauphoetae]|uniref:Clathrin heavy chain n=1 Tax=Blattamonas nauphoetae TaxID=2049346 RepID=A0ABQ9XYS7_9EUKA|nr:putative Clathrin heavy chain 1 [Blattamonas nauphoetae]